MGGGDLNMKKSWHPLLLKNQERVWLEEKKALEEKKKLDQLRKEKEEERQLQELQRLQEEQTGKKRTEKLEWMYTTPATGSSQNPNDLEDYLLGKKRVDKMLIADENAKVGAAHKNFIAVQNANNARDIAAKIREDPLLAIKQQEQAAYQALMSNPLRLRAMQERNGIKPKKDKAERKREKEERRRLRRERKQRKERDSYSRTPSPDGRSPSPHQRSRSYRSRSPHEYRSRSPISPERDFARHSSRRSRSPDFGSRRHEYSPRGVRDGERSRRSRSRSPRHLDTRKRSRSPYQQSSSYKRTRREYSPPPQRRPNPPSYSNNSTATRADEDRQARLEAMRSDASSVTIERQERLAMLLEREKSELAAEEAARAKSRGMGNFLSHEQKKVFGGSGGLEERIRRGRGGMVVDGD